MYHSIKNYCENLITQFDTISTERKEILSLIAQYIQQKRDNSTAINLIYVCTHNSRRSHFGQVWAAVAASFYGIVNVKTFSGGTEATAFNINAINALKKIGFEIISDQKAVNPIYTVKFSESESTDCFSKRYDDEANPKSNFGAIMTCSDADENCPVIFGCDLRIATKYDDPKAFDNTPQQDEKYSERCQQIATEILYMFSLVK